MNIQQRLTQLEQITRPDKAIREPILLKFIGIDKDEQDADKLAGILYVYDGIPATTYNLNSQQLAEYEASERNGTNEVWLNTVPRPRSEAISV